MPYADKPPQSIPGIVGWGGERPSMASLAAHHASQQPQQAAAAPREASKDRDDKGKRLGTVSSQEAEEKDGWELLVAWLQKAWAQESAQRPRAAEALHQLQTIIDALAGTPGKKGQQGRAKGVDGKERGGGGRAPMAQGGADRTGARAPAKAKGGSKLRAPSPRARESGDI